MRLIWPGQLSACRKKAGAMMLEAVEKRWKIGSSSKDGSAVDFKKNSVDLVVRLWLF